MPRTKVKRKCLYRYSVLLLISSLFILVVFVILFSVIKKIHEDGVLAKFSNSSLKFIFFEPKQYLEALNETHIRQFISHHNYEEFMLNKDIYGALKKDSIILVVLVDKLTDNLKYLLASLHQTTGVEDVLIIFSHSYFDENINTLIGSIDFCRVMQIFYPYSIQIYPQEFPGRGARDCSENMKQYYAEKANCTGAFDPDMHGRYRNPLKSQQKHHWWWTANKVFDNLTITVNHNGPVVFVEDNLFLVEDFFYMILYLRKIASTLSQCDFISLGTTSLPKSLKIEDINSADVITWDPKYHSGVLAFDSSVWNSIVSHYDVFCHVDDASWARSLYYLSLNRRDGKRYKVITTAMSRAVKTASCSIYGNSNSCDRMQSVNQVMMMHKHLATYLFPALIEVQINIELEDDDFMVVDYADSGGWGDSRDRTLCMLLTSNKIRKVLVDMRNEFAEYKSEN